MFGPTVAWETCPDDLLWRVGERILGHREFDLDVLREMFRAYPSQNANSYESVRKRLMRRYLELTLSS